ncbi:MAG: response regulator transcription factor [Candidatus Omnitrophica bacterium]|nr:response regulator transcription factor [Candidatus Omnitrophota bacterium]
MIKKSVVVIEDDQSINELIRFNLEKDGFLAEGLANGLDAVSFIEQRLPALILLDIMLPGLDGFEVCRRLKNNDKTAHIPVIMITARGTEVDVVRGLQLGAEDYVVKPFSPQVLLARVRAVLRRVTSASGLHTGDRRIIGDLVLDTDKHKVTCKNEVLEVTALEFSILEFLSRSPGRVYTRDQMLENIWKEGRFIVDRAVDVHVRNLRKKMGDAQDHIETVRGVGYRFKEID